MVLSILLIAVLAYALGTLNCCSLIGRHVLKDDSGAATYAAIQRKFGYQGAFYVLVADLVKALVAVLIGGMLLKAAGHPSVGKQTAMLFALLGQAMPFPNLLRPREGLIFPALLLLWVDWRLFAICLVVAFGLMLLTGDRAVGALGGAVAFPVFLLILGGWWLKILLAVLSAAALVYIYRDGLRRFFAGMGKRGNPGAGSRKDQQDK